VKSFFNRRLSLPNEISRFFHFNYMLLCATHRKEFAVGDSPQTGSLRNRLESRFQSLPLPVIIHLPAMEIEVRNPAIGLYVIKRMPKMSSPIRGQSIDCKKIEDALKVSLQQCMTKLDASRMIMRLCADAPHKGIA